LAYAGAEDTTKERRLRAMHFLRIATRVDVLSSWAKATFRRTASWLLLFNVLLAGNVSAQYVQEGLNPGPDAIAGNMAALMVFGVEGTQNGVVIGLTTCNGGNQFINYFAIPDTRHPAVASNLYRMSGGTNNNDRFEQIGQSWVKHTFGAKQA